MSDSGKILFSIIIPTYNRANLIGKAIQSVIDQTYTNWELIVVDDGSTDNTRETVNSYIDFRIKYFFQENKELNGARNSGILYSIGDYIGFLDDDDYFLIDHLEILYNVITKNNNKIAIYKNGLLMKLRDKFIKIESYNELKHKNPINYILFGETNLLPLIFHKETFKYNKFNLNCLLFDDHHFIIRVLLQFPLIETNKYTCVYVKHPKARTVMYHLQNGKKINLLNCIDNLFLTSGTEIIRHTHKNIKKELLSTFYISFAHKALEFQNYKETFRNLIIANKIYFKPNIVKRSIIVFLRIIYRLLFK